MRVVERRHCLVIETRPWYLSLLWLVVMLGLGFLGWRQWQADAAMTPAVIGLWLAVLLGLLLALPFAEHSRFVFDPKRGDLRWRRVGLLRRYRGTLRLADIAGLDVVAFPGPKGSRHWTLMIDHPAGALPMSSGEADSEAAWRKAAAAIAGMLPQTRPDPDISA